MGDLWARCVRRMVVRWFPSHRPGPDPAVGVGFWDWLGSLIAGVVAAPAARRAAPPLWAVRRLLHDLRIADCVDPSGCSRHAAFSMGRFDRSLLDAPSWQHEQAATAV